MVKRKMPKRYFLIPLLVFVVAVGVLYKKKMMPFGKADGIEKPIFEEEVKPKVEIKRVWVHNCKLLSTEYLKKKKKMVPFTYRNYKPDVTFFRMEDIPEEYITIWLCPTYGRLVCKQEKVFRFAKNGSSLFIEEWYVTPSKILDIKNDLC